MEAPQKIKLELPYDSANLLPGNYLKGKKLTDLKRCMHLHIHGSIIYSSQTQKQPKYPSIDE